MGYGSNRWGMEWVCSAASWHHLSRPVRICLSTAMKFNSATWLKLLHYFVAIVLGQALYFALAPHLPLAARHQPFHFDLGTIIDFWFCLFIYGLIQLLVFLHHRWERRT